MTLLEIKQAISEGKRAYWSNKGYRIIQDNKGQYLIIYLSNEYYIGLTWKDGKTLNGDEKDFFID